MRNEIRGIYVKAKSIARASFGARCSDRSGQADYSLNPSLIHEQDSCSINSSFFWAELPGLISDEFHNLLCNEFPRKSYFDKHVGIPRGPIDSPQRPHDRYYLALNSGPYSRKRTIFGNRGIIKSKSLSDVWKRFIQQLEGEEYRQAMARLLQTDQYITRYAWHMGYSGTEISPHFDDLSKLGTHIFYFNRQNDWNESWGGNTMMLSGLTRQVLNPEFSDFTNIHMVSNVGNNSLFWRNSTDAWHGVRPLDAPEGSFRKIFTVVFDTIK